MSRNILLRILRSRPGVVDPPQYQDYSVDYEDHMSVLDGLEQIRRHQAPDLLYRHCCHHASCGTCACHINGQPRLACVTAISGLEGPVVVEPLPHFELLADLVVDMHSLQRNLAEEWSGLRRCEPLRPPPPGVGERLRLEDCIDCGCCVAACPVAAAEAPFLGPAALAAINRELTGQPEQASRLLDLAGGETGERHCVRAIECSRRCPTGVSPARHIAELRRQLAQRADR